MSAERFVVISYNCDENREIPHVRAQAQLDNEIEAMLAHGFAVLLMQECVGYKFQRLPGKTLVRGAGSVSRENLALYVDNEHFVGRNHVRWHDLSKTWMNQKNNGQHPPRSYVDVLLDIGGTKVVASDIHISPIQPHRPDHAAQRAAQDEQLEALARRGKRATRPWVRIGDVNGNPAEMAKRIGGHAIGNKLDAVLASDEITGTAEYPTSLHGVKFGTDHEHALIAHLTVHAKEAA